MCTCVCVYMCDLMQQDKNKGWMGMHACTTDCGLCDMPALGWKLVKVKGMQQCRLRQSSRCSEYAFYLSTHSGSKRKALPIMPKKSVLAPGEVCGMEGKESLLEGRHAHYMCMRAQKQSIKHEHVHRAGGIKGTEMQAAVSRVRNFVAGLMQTRDWVPICGMQAQYRPNPHQ